jgi:hypothetical protein
MSMRRRRKKLTNVLSGIDRRLRATSLRQVKRVTLAGSDSIEETETTTPANSTPPVGTEISVVAPDQWVKIIGGYYYPPNKTGGLGQVELFLDENPQLSYGDSMFVSGIQVKWAVVSGTPPKTYAGSFYPHTGYENSESIRIVSKSGSPDWSGRAASTKPTYRAVTSGVTNTIIYTITNKTEIPNSVAISFRGRVASYFASTTTATITFTAAHYFRVSQIIDVSSLGAPMADVDGIVQITSVPSSTQISYEFVKPRSASIANTVVTDEKYAYGVVSKYTPIGSSWIDPTTKKVFIWDGLRWSGYTDALEEGLVTNDGLPPAPPTSLSLTSLGYAEDGVLGKVAKSSVALSWTGPTTNSTGGPLNDLAGYRIWYSTTSATGPWIGKQNFGLETEQTIVGLTPDLTYYFKVIAFDSYGLDSDGLNGSIIALKAALSVETPSAPTLKSKFGTVTVTWDGKDYTNSVIPTSILARVDIHMSTTTGFTPSSTTLVGKLLGGSDFQVITDVEYNTDYYFKLIAVDINGRSTTASVQSTIKVKPLVDADLIAAKLNAPLSSWPFAEKAVTAGALADGAINGSDVFGPEVVKREAIAALAIGADQIATDAITAGKIKAGEITAAKIASLTIEAGNIKSNAIETDKIDAGAITGVKIAARAITGDKILATTSITFADSVDGNGDPASGSSRVIIGNHAVPSYPVTITGLSFIESGTTKGIIGTSGQWADFMVGNEATVNNLQWSYNSETAVHNAYLRATGSIDLGNYGGNDISITAAGTLRLTSASNTVALMNRMIMAMGTTDDGIWATPQTGIPRLLITPAGTMYPTTASTGATTAIHQSGSGQALYRSTSSRRYKVLEEPLDMGLSILNLNPKTWIDKGQYEANGNKAEGLKRFPGFIAEDLDEAGFGAYVHHNEDGSAESINYGELVSAIIPVLKNYQSRISELESTIDEMKKA